MAPTVTPYVLENTEVRELVADSLGRSYPVLVSLPESYRSNPTRRYPVVVVTDAPYSFPLVRSMAARMSNHGGDLEEFVLVGLAYAKGDTPANKSERVQPWLVVGAVALGVARRNPKG